MPKGRLSQATIDRRVALVGTLLTSLPHGADAIADYLLNEHYQGLPTYVGKDPLQSLIWARVGVRCEIGLEWICCHFDDTEVYVSTPDWVTNFLTRYRQGQYPALENLAKGRNAADGRIG